MSPYPQIPFLMLGSGISLIWCHFYSCLLSDWLFTEFFSNCSNSLNFEAKINCNTFKSNVPKWRKTCTGLKFDFEPFDGPCIKWKLWSTLQVNKMRFWNTLWHLISIGYFWHEHFCKLLQIHDSFHHTLTCCKSLRRMILWFSFVSVNFDSFNPAVWEDCC